MSEIEFKTLKQEIFKEFQNTDLLEAKRYFEYHISSRRSLNSVKTLNDIFNLLEERDVIQSNEVTALQYFGEYLENEKMIELVNGYQKFYVDKTCVCICGIHQSFNPPTFVELVDSSEECLRKAILNVAQNIGENWRELLSELNVPECYIDKVREKYPNDFSQQALKALLVWKDFYEERATEDALKMALESRLCKMKGIGLHMLKPSIRVQ